MWCCWVFINFLQVGTGKLVLFFRAQLKLHSCVNSKNSGILKVKNAVAESAYHLSECIFCSATKYRIWTDRLLCRKTKYIEMNVTTDVISHKYREENLVPSVPFDKECSCDKRRKLTVYRVSEHSLHVSKDGAPLCRKWIINRKKALQVAYLTQPDAGGCHCKHLL